MKVIALLLAVGTVYVLLHKGSINVYVGSSSSQIISFLTAVLYEKKGGKPWENSGSSSSTCNDKALTAVQTVFFAEVVLNRGEGREKSILYVQQ